PQIDYLRKRGLSVEAACSPDPRIERLRARGYTIHEIQIDRKISPLPNSRTVMELGKLMRAQHYDLVHTHAPVASALGRVAAKLAGIQRIVYTAHGFYFHDDMPRHQYALYHGVEKSIARITDRVLVQSQEDFDTAVTTGIGSAAKIRYLGNGIDVARFDGAAVSAERRAQLRTELRVPDHHGPILGITGRITEEKGFGELIEAMSELREDFPEAHLIVIGGQLSTERDAFQARLVDVIGERGLDSHVTFTGFRDDVQELLGLLDVFVLPSYREGLPRSVLEAMAMELPVVATRIRGCREAVVDQVTGLLVPARDGGALKRAIAEILSDRALAQRFGKAGRERVVSTFDERFVFARLENYYRELGVSFE
ncbi:MAG: glycosyltransferase family 4 protein, partial [Deltaproteobacteria bacterium]|nr:glycosyltransferase family 4 protein [Deltaproteobacteria bacterium]